MKKKKLPFRNKNYSKIFLKLNQCIENRTSVYLVLNY